MKFAEFSFHKTTGVKNAKNVANYVFFSGKIEKFWSRVGVKDLTNSKSGREACYPKWGILEHFPQS